MTKNIIFFGWVAAAVALFLYSFTQIDLSLAFSKFPFLFEIQKNFQYIGYFNRPLSTIIFICIAVVSFLLYITTLNLIRKKLIEIKNLWKIILVVSVILFASYNAFSYDLFNYIFDAKIFVHYQENPYEHKALDYPEDPMLSFMRWTHRTYPYGPIWLSLTTPLYIVGLGIFAITFYIFKLIALLSFLGSVFLIGKIAEKLKFDPVFSMAAFALNPLVLTESLVSAHNDIIMVFFALLALVTYLERRYVRSILFLLFSIGIKYATVLMIPAFFAKGIFKVKNEAFIYWLIGGMLLAVIAVTFRTNFQPWYLLLVLPFASFVQNKYFIMIPVVIISLAAMSQYVPYLYMGNWDPPIPDILNSTMLGSILASALLTLGYKQIKK